MIGGVPVSWKSKRQQTVALSTAEAEYMALSDASREVTWLRGILLNFNCERHVKLCKLMNLVRKSRNSLNLSEGGVLGMSPVTQTQ